ncbi:MAG: M23 family metallopeptidase, partial [Bacteroidota bacterium]
MLTRLLLLLFALLSHSGLFSQTSYPIKYFRSPVDSTLSLSGNFGEIRPNHFHAGFDIRTNNREGEPVYAAADGYISRIKISSLGYGKALYVTHPNGYTTVYAHLQRFNKNIQNFAQKIQYADESFEIDTLLTADLFPVKKAELIALSGNTGGSESPHLHFEIRDTKTEIPINPYYFGYEVADTIKPRITQLAVYPIGNNAFINGKHQVKKIIPLYTRGKYTYLKTDTVNVNGDIGFGIECYDTELRSAGKNSVFSIELQSGGKRVFYYELEKFSFDNSRYVNAHIDYADKQKHNTRIQKCFLSKNNQIEIYKDVLNNGVISFTDDSIHWIRFIVKDFVGNLTELMLKVKSSSKSEIKMEPTSTMDVWDCTKANEYKNEEVQIAFPAYSFYDDLKFNYFKSPALKGTYSSLHHIQNDQTAVQKAITLSIKASTLPETIQKKACIISVDKKGKRNYEKGEYKNGWVITQTKNLGSFAISIDTLAPKIRPNFKITDKNNVDLRRSKIIGVTVKDDLSGIKKYRATIDGKWILCEYDAKQ